MSGATQACRLVLLPHKQHIRASVMRTPRGSAGRTLRGPAASLPLTKPSFLLDIDAEEEGSHLLGDLVCYFEPRLARSVGDFGQSVVHRETRRGYQSLCRSA